MNQKYMKNDTPRWKRLLSESIIDLDALPHLLPTHREKLERVVSRYPMRINPYYLGLIGEENGPIYRQCVPDIRELDDADAAVDPLNEEGHSPVYGLTHRYPDRVLLLVSSECAMYCRFCNRKRKVGRGAMVTDTSIEQGIGYIRAHEEVRDVLLSGGDPLLLEDAAPYRTWKSYGSAQGSPAPCPNGSRRNWLCCFKNFIPSISMLTSTILLKLHLKPPWRATAWPTRESLWVVKRSS
jgi:L-lysine 2,3-aminomutase